MMCPVCDGMFFSGPNKDSYDEDLEEYFLDIMDKYKPFSDYIYKWSITRKEEKKRDWHIKRALINTQHIMTATWVQVFILNKRIWSFSEMT